jgi:hypothetical protein
MSQKLSQSLGSSVDQIVKNPNFAVIFWINGWEKHRSPFGKVVDGYVVYNFRIWRFSSFIQNFWVWTGQTAIHQTENKADTLERPPAPSRAPSPCPDVRALAVTSRGARCHAVSAPLPPRQQNHRTAPSFPLLSPLSPAIGVDTRWPSLPWAPRAVHAGSGGKTASLAVLSLPRSSSHITPPLALALELPTLPRLNATRHTATRHGCRASGRRWPTAALAVLYASALVLAPPPSRGHL